MSAYTTYFELSLRRDPEIASPVLMSALTRHVHQASAQAAIPFAIAFPKLAIGGHLLGSVLRVFTRDVASAEQLYDGLDRRPSVEQLATGSRIRTAASGTARYEVYMRKRISANVSIARRSDEIAVQKQAQAKIRQMAEQRPLPYVWMRSSSGNEFKLVIEKVLLASDSDGDPDGYGLSRASQIVALPLI